MLIYLLPRDAGADRTVGGRTVIAGCSLQHAAFARRRPHATTSAHMHLSLVTVTADATLGESVSSTPHSDVSQTAETTVDD